MANDSDPFDDDDFFADIDLKALEEVEAKAISATQAVRAARPPPITSNLLKEPRPVNTEPRAGGKSTFGFGELGKHTHPANETRYIEGVEKRKQYWGIRRDDDEKEEDGYPAVTLDATGRYDIAGDTDDDDQVVDTHAPGGRGVAYTRTAALQRNAPDGTQNSHARRESAGHEAGPSRLPMNPPRNGPTSDTLRMPAPAPSHLPEGSTRVLARSASVGKQVFAPRGGRHQSGLAPIQSQSNPSQSMPSSSQGSQARRSVLQLDDEKRRRGELEREVERLHAQLQASKTQPRHWTDGIQVDMGPGNPEDKVRELQAQVWKAQGEAENVRRLQKTDSEKHMAETERLRASIAERDRRIAEKERENAARVESVKSQAIFATHAAFNSASRTRSARAAIAELNQTGLGSPPRRTRGQTVEILSPRKPEVRETAAPFRFGGLQNGFAASPQLRQTIQSRRPATSPKTGTRNHEVQSTPASPRMDEHHETLGQDDAADWDDHSQLVYHVFNYRGTARATEDRWTESLLNRLLRYQPDSMSTQYTSASARLLQAASDMKASVYHAAGEILESLSGFFSVIARSVMVNRQPDKSTIGAMINVLDLISSTVYFFPTCFVDTCQELINDLRKLVQHFFTVSNLGRRQVELQKLSIEQQGLLADQSIRVCEVMCWSSGLGNWIDDSLAAIIIMLSDSKHGFPTVERAFDLLLAASSKPSNFRALVSSSDAARADDHRKTRIDLPLVERASKYLATPHPDCSRSEYSRLNVTIIKAVSMMSLANPDAPVLLSERSSLVPALIILVHRESARLLGMGSPGTHSVSALLVLSMSLGLLHQLVYPSPLLSHNGLGVPRSTSQGATNPFKVESQNDADLKAVAPQGVDLQARLLSASSVKEFSGLQHVFVAALGSIAYCEPGDRSFRSLPLDDDLASDASQTAVAWRAIQYLGQDLLEAVVEGPEADEIYEMYYSGDFKAGHAGKKPVDAMDVDDGEDEDEEGYAAMRDTAVIEV